MPVHLIGESCGRLLTTAGKPLEGASTGRDGAIRGLAIGEIPV